MSDVSIFVCCHKDYKSVGIKNPVYKLITDKDIKNKSKLELIKTDGYLDNRLWSELSQIYYVWKHPKLQKDWVGFCHYRRYFDFMNKIPELTKPVIPQKIIGEQNHYINYDINHNHDDLLQVYNIIKEKYPDYRKAFVKMMDSHYYIPYNMFIMPKKMFNDYCKFIFGVLFEFGKEIRIENSYINMIKRIGLDKEHYIKKPIYPNNSYDYQARIYGFLSERLSTAFFFKYIMDKEDINSLEEIPVKVTEKTYNRI